MLQDAEIWFRAVGALAAVLLLAWGAARALRRSPLAARPGRRLRIGETLALDSRRRLVLASCDGREMLLLLGGTTDLPLGWLPREEPPCDSSR